MTRKTSAGLLLYRRRAGELEVLLVHPGGPLWQGKDDGAWSIPKGEHGVDEPPLDAARREFAEETGLHPAGPFLALEPVTLRSGKLVRAWAVLGDCDPTTLRSILFRMEWPPHSGQTREFPEVDRADFFPLATARRKLNPGQVPLLDDLQAKLDAGPQHGGTGLFLAGLCIVLALSGCGDDGPTRLPESPVWHKFAANPVLTGGLADLWEWDAAGVSSPSVLRLAPDSLMMWYTSRDATKSRIGLATSRDGLSWRKHAENPALDTGAPGTWDELAVEHPNVRFDGVLFTMYYAGTGEAGGGIGIATSPDGIHWRRHPTNPVFTAGPPGTWDDTRVFTPWVRVDGNDHFMWYTGRGRYLAIGYATSSDGLLWNRLMTPVLHPEVLEAATFAPCVLAGDGLYRIWYGAIHESTGGGAQPGTIDYAQSIDGVDWTAQRRVLGPGDAGSWDARALKGGCVLRDGEQLRMWFTGEAAVALGDSTAIVSAIGVATLE